MSRADRTPRAVNVQSTPEVQCLFPFCATKVCLFRLAAKAAWGTPPPASGSPDPDDTFLAVITKVTCQTTLYHRTVSQYHLRFELRRIRPTTFCHRIPLSWTTAEPADSILTDGPVLGDVSWLAVQVESIIKFLCESSFGLFPLNSGLMSPSAGFAVAVRPAPRC
jgi:hypothetical protein